MSEPVYHLDIFSPDLVTAAADEIMKMVPLIPYGVTPNGGTPCLLFVFIDAQQTYLTPAQREAIESNLKAGRPLVGVIFLDKRDNQWTSCPAGDEHCRETYVQTRRREAFHRFMEGKFKVDGSHDWESGVPGVPRRRQGPGL
jgi:hypothetical protein